MQNQFWQAYCQTRHLSSVHQKCSSEMHFITIALSIPKVQKVMCMYSWSNLYTNIFVFTILVLGLVSNESPGNFTFYRGIHKFLNPSIFLKITVFFLFYAIIVISQKILWNGNYSIKPVFFFKIVGILNSRNQKITVLFEK